MTIEIRLLGPADGAYLEHMAPDVFDDPIDPPALAQFLSDPRHHLIVALDGDLIVGFVSAVHYIHPDKTHPELWVNEVGVGATYQNRGIAKAMMEKTLEVARALKCTEAWVLAERSNTPAMRLYTSAGGHEAPQDAVMFTFYLNPPG